MKHPFSKYHGTGNDFILIDNRKNNIQLDNAIIAQLCNRHFGIGADGIMILKSSEKFDFEMIYFNADGEEGTMCGNGGRCITFFAKDLGIINNKTRFRAIDGEHEAEIKSAKGNEAIVSLKLSDVNKIENFEDYYLIDTGSPHYVQFVKNINKVNILEEGKRLRWDKKFQPNGVNVNFVEIKGGNLEVRTFERGVENITLSCGTGVTASAIAAHLVMSGRQESFNVKTYGGELKVRFSRNGELFTDIWLEGPAMKVFEGKIEI